MKLTIHGVERQQQRTELSLRELLRVFSRDAFVDLGQVERSTYTLFYDKYQNKCLIAVIREEHLVTILRLGYKIPDEISLQINKEVQHRARVRYYTLVENQSLREVDSLTITLDVLAVKTAHKELVIENWMVIDKEGAFKITRLEILSICVDAIDDLLKRQNLVAKLTHTLRVGVKLIDKRGKPVGQWRFTLGEIIKARKTEEIKFDCVLDVKEKHTTFTYRLGLITPEIARSDDSLLLHFSEKIDEVIAILVSQLPQKRLKDVIYQLRVVDIPTDIQTRLVHRRHESLVAIQTNRTPV